MNEYLGKRQNYDLIAGFMHASMRAHAINGSQPFAGQATIANGALHVALKTSPRGRRRTHYAFDGSNSIERIVSPGQQARGRRQTQPIILVQLSHRAV
jgi:hypothetical protein